MISIYLREEARMVDIDYGTNRFQPTWTRIEQILIPVQEVF